jgi:hypothetical protein
MRNARSVVVLRKRRKHADMSSMATIDASDDLSLVPPRRLGVLVAAARTRQDLTIDQVARRSSGRLSTHDVRLLEAGRLALEDADVRLLAELLGLPLGRLVPERSKLVIDRTEGRIICGDSVGRFVPMASPEEIAVRYLALIRALRVGMPGAERSPVVPMRTDDLAVLAEALGRSEVAVRDLLNHALATGQVTIGDMSRRSVRRPLMPGLGILVALTSLGGLLLVPSHAAMAAEPTVVASRSGARVDVGTALMLERDVADGVISTLESAGTTRPLTSVRLGDAQTIEMADESADTAVDEPGDAS